MTHLIQSELLARSQSRLPTLNKLIATNGVQYLERKEGSELFMHLAKTVVGQQLSKAAATTIWNRVVALAKSKNSSLYDCSTAKNFENLRTCGLSRFKVKAILELKLALEKSLISDEIYTTDQYELIVSEITSLWGFGPWSAEMTALFFFAHPDVWSTSDAALSRGLRTIASKDNVTEDDILFIVSPYRSFLSLHLWKGIDTKIL